ncbi:MAG: dephospho-CoA kinase [Hyphomicrobiaceae bacterium]|nr:dephospho-CoA kinase [Hyphomicrobiaceae bacterium]
MLVIGLTGSIGTGKTTAADYLADKGLLVWSADGAVHDLYRGTTAQLIEQAFPGTVQQGEVDRERLTRYLMSFPQELGKLEAIIHPLVEQDRARFIADHRAKGSRTILLDIPLLFEKNLHERVDLALLIAASPEVQRARVLARPRMSVAKFDMLRARQMDQDEKRQKADYIIDNSTTLEEFYQALDQFLEKLPNSA